VVTLVRAVGWALFGVCAILFVAVGGFGAAREGSAIAMAAGIGMPVAMFVTVTATTVLHWRAVRRTRLHVPGRPAYKVRPLDPPAPPTPAPRDPP
jgi:hypothetical protein